MSNKKETKLTPAEEEEQAWLAKQVKKPKDAGDTPAATGETAQREGEEVLPPPDPPVVPSPPQPPATGYEVDESEKGAQPEDPAPLRELQLAVEGTRGVGPSPEPPPEAPPPEIP